MFNVGRLLAVRKSAHLVTGFYQLMFNLFHEKSPGGLFLKLAILLFLKPEFSDYRNLFGIVFPSWQDFFGFQIVSGP
jgi:hypothetical protein